MKANQAKAENIAVMGPQLGAIYSELWQEVAWIHQKWSQYVELFGTSDTRVDLVNEAAPSLFRTVQDTLFEAVLLHLARLTDRTKAVLSLHLLPKTLTAGTPVATKVSDLVNTAVEATEFARDWRHRKLAHRNLQLALGGQAEPLAPASRAAVKAALSSLVDVLNALSSHYLDSTTQFDLGPGGDDAVGLLYIIRDGLRFNEQRRERLRRGTFSDDDLKPDPI